MTKSKSMGRGGSRKGAGRPRFNKTGKASYISIRITQKTRDLIEAEARRCGDSLATLAERLLETGLEERAERREKGPLRALCFLIKMLSKNGPYDEDLNCTWHSNPYMFEAFRTSVSLLFDRLRPPGEVVAPPRRKSSTLPEPLRRQNPSGDPLEWFFPDLPQEYGRTRAEVLLVWMQLFSPEGASPDYLNRLDIPPGAAWDRDKAVREFYGLAAARRDLGLKGPITGLTEDLK